MVRRILMFKKELKLLGAEGSTLGVSVDVNPGVRVKDTGPSIYTWRSGCYKDQNGNQNDQVEFRLLANVKTTKRGKVRPVLVNFSLSQNELKQILEDSKNG